MMIHEEEEEEDYSIRTTKEFAKKVVREGHLGRRLFTRKKAICAGEGDL